MGDMAARLHKHAEIKFPVAATFHSSGGAARYYFLRDGSFRSGLWRDILYLIRARGAKALACVWDCIMYRAWSIVMASCMLATHSRTTGPTDGWNCGRPATAASRFVLGDINAKRHFNHLKLRKAKKQGSKDDTKARAHDTLRKTQK